MEPYKEQSVNDTYLALMQMFSFLRSCPEEFTFEADEPAFIRAAFADFVRIVGDKHADLVQLSKVRRALEASGFLIERKWFRKERWSTLRKVDHFYRNDLLGKPIDIESAAQNFCAP